jgi:hypothetical protein
MANRIQVKVQQVSGAAPTPLLHGELGVNLGDTPPTLWIGNAANTPVKVGPAIVSASAPVGPAEGTFWFEPSGATLQIYQNGVWHPVGGVDGVNAPSATPTNDAGKAVLLNAQGKIAPGFFSIPGGFNFRGRVDVTAAGTVPATPQPGDYVQNSAAAAGPADAAWGTTGTHQPNTILLFDGLEWNDVGTNLDLSGFLPLAGGFMTPTARVEFEVPVGANPAIPPIRLDGVVPEKSAIDNFTLSGGVIAAPTLAAITASASAVSANSADVTIAGGPADKTYTLTLSYTADGTPGTATVNILLHDTSDMVANRLVAAIPAVLSAVKTGPSVVKVGLGTAAALTVLNVAIV